MLFMFFIFYLALFLTSLGLITQIILRGSELRGSEYGLLCLMVLFGGASFIGLKNILKEGISNYFKQTQR